MNIEQKDMMAKLDMLESFIGNTPLKKLDSNYVDLYAKIEYNNFSGSIKDRPAINILRNAVKNGHISRSSIIVESSSGNFAVALATLCNVLGLKFIAVVDPNINDAYEKYLRLLSYRVVKVDIADSSGAYLKSRIEVVKDICLSGPNFYWPNQYENPDNYGAYHKSLAEEIIYEIPDLDYLFVAVSSCGTLIGLSRRLKEHNPVIQVIAVDVDGSMIFSKKPRKRYLSGLGSSIRSPLIDKANIDHVISLSEPEIIDGCYRLLFRHSLFAGASSGASFFAVEKYFREQIVNQQGYPEEKKKALFLICDKGSSYINTVYDKNWSKNLYNVD